MRQDARVAASLRAVRRVGRHAVTGKAGQQVVADRWIVECAILDQQLSAEPVRESCAQACAAWSEILLMRLKTPNVTKPFRSPEAVRLRNSIRQRLQGQHAGQVVDRLPEQVAHIGGIVTGSANT